MEQETTNKQYNKQIIINIIISFVQIIVVSLTTVLVYRHIAKVLGIELFGLWSVVLSLTTFASLGNLGFSTSMFKFSAELGADYKFSELNGLVNISFILMIFLVSIVALIIYFVSIYFIPNAVPSKYIYLGLSLVPYSLIAYALNTFGGFFFSVSDGLNKGYLRSLAIIVSNLFFVVCCYFLIRKFQLLGLAYAQIIQYSIFFLFSFFSLKKTFPKHKIFYFNYDKRLILDSIKFGLNSQFVSLTTMFYDPVTKYFLLKYGGLSSVGYFDMASKILIQIKTLVNTIFTNLFPKLVVKNHKSKNIDEIKEIYLRMNNFNILIISILFSGVFLFSSLISNIMLGNNNPIFVTCIYILGVANLINLINSPAYYMNYSTGHLKGNLYAHFLIAISNPILCYIFGSLNHDWGVIIGWSISLILGGIFIIIEYQSRSKTPLLSLFTLDNFYMFLVLVLAGLFGLLLPIKLSNISLLVSSSFIFLIALIGIFKVNPLFKTMYLFNKSTLGL